VPCPAQEVQLQIQGGQAALRAQRGEVAELEAQRQAAQTALGRLQQELEAASQSSLHHQQVSRGVRL
jgi:hypothetical protein